jgi:hypothetical protein
VHSASKLGDLHPASREPAARRTKGERDRNFFRCSRIRIIELWRISADTPGCSAEAGLFNPNSLVRYLPHPRCI